MELHRLDTKVIVSLLLTSEKIQHIMKILISYKDTVCNKYIWGKCSPLISWFENASIKYHSINDSKIHWFLNEI